MPAAPRLVCDKIRRPREPIQQRPIYAQFSHEESWFPMFGEWRQPVIARLLAAAHEDGGWGYARGAPGSAEPTALAVLALREVTEAVEARGAGLRFLSRLQRPDGGVPVCAGVPDPAWPTALALLAWMRCGDDTTNATAKRAVQWLIQARGEATASDAVDHDGSLVGWSWAAGTHSWVEPTGYAVLALRAAGEREHPRVREGVRLLLDRVIPEGGWNYGNRTVLGNTLLPFPATTGVVLAALVGEPDAAPIRESLGYLERELRRVRTPLSLAWSLIALHAWGRRPSQADDWLDEAARRSERAAHPHLDAMLLLAAARKCPLIAD